MQLPFLRDGAEDGDLHEEAVAKESASDSHSAPILGHGSHRPSLLHTSPAGISALAEYHQRSSPGVLASDAVHLRRKIEGREL